jgi:hypothetical protein
MDETEKHSEKGRTREWFVRKALPRQNLKRPDLTDIRQTGNLKKTGTLIQKNLLNPAKHTSLNFYIGIWADFLS